MITLMHLWALSAGFWKGAQGVATCHPVLLAQGLTSEARPSEKNQTGLGAVQKALCVAKQGPPKGSWGRTIETYLIWEICHPYTPLQAQRPESQPFSPEEISQIANYL